ncbi:hypothetical protein AAMO2058_001148000 [Amorphochlora amoebiformis]
MLGRWLARRGPMRWRKAGVAWISLKAYKAEVKSIFSKLESGLEPMKDMNDGFEIAKEELRMTVTIGAPGSYIFTPDEKKKNIQMFSPISGNVYTYKFDEKSEQWANVNDGHYMIELLTRELMGACSGLPDL